MGFKLVLKGLNSSLVGGEWSASNPDRFIQAERNTVILLAGSYIRKIQTAAERQ
jgi:hypothetical protein